jgi:protein tyrosine/serine phosphatase
MSQIVPTMDIVKSRGGRPKKYNTDEEWREAKRIANQNYYAKNKQLLTEKHNQYYQNHSEEVKMRSHLNYERKKVGDSNN